ncbi:SagB/ThcOx family dehydrogenase [Candidatus Wolfebacteria bacterium]|nr:SagB/ThcOx family dehydrogenase [Candidatus Wolfebacteria bacterium]
MNDLPDFSALFHQSSKDHSKNSGAKIGGWPAEWTTTYYKTYPRLRKIKLGDAPLSGSLSELIVSRESRREFSPEPLTNADIGTLLKYSCGITGRLDDERYRRAHPSGGARFPIEVYPVVVRGSDIKSGLYHYNVKDHALDVLWEREFTPDDIGNLFTYEWVKNAAVVFVMTAVFWRMQNKYGLRGYRHILLEAGHIGQNVYLVAEAMGLKCCAISGTRDQNLEKLIDIDGVTESVVYAIAVGQ